MAIISDAEYERLLDAEKFLDALWTLGVDSWEGYETAYQLYRGEISEDDI